MRKLLAKLFSGSATKERGKAAKIQHDLTQEEVDQLVRRDALASAHAPAATVERGIELGATHGVLEEIRLSTLNTGRVEASEKIASLMGEPLSKDDLEILLKANIRGDGTWRNVEYLLTKLGRSLSEEELDRVASELILGRDLSGHFVLKNQFPVPDYLGDAMITKAIAVDDAHLALNVARNGASPKMQVAAVEFALAKDYPLFDMNMPALEALPNELIERVLAASVESGHFPTVYWLASHLDRTLTRTEDETMVAFHMVRGDVSSVLYLLKRVKRKLLQKEWDTVTAIFVEKSPLENVDRIAELEKQSGFAFSKTSLEVLIRRYVDTGRVGDAQKLSARRK
ncbi:MAG: hypothetical protein A3C93_02710 [Candidatus Lloydbacteria bacterium RIFCSPHIGHO2_02_FULL_54_17]|uniref:Uncharacterized protein n=1 Tax=Candidatus Lloydbacteria bacterium RIFCSPHIGHO2_02_FULL_54_17 TaxID=1798664 RepID=A0A1G2DBU0_9BACT|nr:MAG: hypothetical protein A2762_05960 [Candidatus Lloydbacteria bacterium RIFCSPHIGHO2_01_FULL_54_11]OGZ10932.1 MAG: hypothetical protein A3C93_02710 [Candidatus Lloydbacteria bacterium RIFCSPHIGHO2_02_FULL_54_17]OGZ14913.1 MAG: hypothetical protein A2948_05305 [Candidatus Lloydbacteria bacterium RIFCSPLOWO2_01_FULL_54_18]OGZ15870.1 MAG: hypothetical protein A3H76_06825 [Candidatus Lloydbacteria bacterium RIFCSPLOWO2_02_FULL_54_12]